LAAKPAAAGHDFLTQNLSFFKIETFERSLSNIAAAQNR